MKKCSRCKSEKLDSEFYKDKTKKSGIASRCIICVREVVKEWSKRNPNKLAETQRRFYKKYPEKALLKARKWRKDNPEKVRILNKRMRQKMDKNKVRAMNKAWLLANPNKRKKYWKRQYEKEIFRVKHRERAKQWRENNRELYLAKLKIWRKDNKGKILANSKIRKLSALKAIPKWANLRRIKSIYMACADKPGFQVDHIIPILGKNVCGLHVENNLRIITKLDNLEKSNKLLQEFCC